MTRLAILLIKHKPVLEERGIAKIRRVQSVTAHLHRPGSAGLKHPAYERQVRLVGGDVVCSGHHEQQASDYLENDEGANGDQSRFDLRPIHCKV